jgi:hypothetical protein
MEFLEEPGDKQFAGLPVAAGLDETCFGHVMLLLSRMGCAAYGGKRLMGWRDTFPLSAGRSQALTYDMQVAQNSLSCGFGGERR